MKKFGIDYFTDGSMGRNILRPIEPSIHLLYSLSNVSKGRNILRPFGPLTTFIILNGKVGSKYIATINPSTRLLTLRQSFAIQRASPVYSNFLMGRTLRPINTFVIQ